MNARVKTTLINFGIQLHCTLTKVEGTWEASGKKPPHLLANWQTINLKALPPPSVTVRALFSWDGDGGDDVCSKTINRFEVAGSSTSSHAHQHAAFLCSCMTFAQS